MYVLIYSLIYEGKNLYWDICIIVYEFMFEIIIIFFIVRGKLIDFYFMFLSIYKFKEIEVNKKLIK